MSHLPLPSPLVSLEWLADHLGDQRLVVVDASTSATNPVTGMPMGAHDAYLITGHIPGAVYADTADSFREPGAPFPPARPGLERLEQVLRALGIDNTSTVVIYDSAFGQWAARVWWILRAAGLDRVALLNGGPAGGRAGGGVVGGGGRGGGRGGASGRGRSHGPPPGGRAYSARARRVVGHYR